VSYGLAPGALDDDVDVQSEEMLVNMGPQHPSTHGVLRIVLRTDGEMVLEAVPHLGYLHRCKEKIAENLAYYQYIGYTDRLDYLAAMNNNHAWAMAVEKAGRHRGAAACGITFASSHRSSTGSRPTW
jgi:NADH-quinone oxidoreductase subunit D